MEEVSGQFCRFHLFLFSPFSPVCLAARLCGVAGGKDGEGARPEILMALAVGSGN